MTEKILLTGVAGFIGYHVAMALLGQGKTVVGIDNLNDYYDVGLKQARLEKLKAWKGFTFHQICLSDREKMHHLVTDLDPDISRIVHMAAQAGVRYSLSNPHAYGVSNLDGHLVMLEAARKLGPRLKHFVYASSSSVYGGNAKQPLSVDDPVNLPVSLYAATKRAGEMMTQSYAHLYHIPATGLRFFTVYGPYGRPDMAYFSFTRDILEGKAITVFNDGLMKRDFTWIDDIVSGVLAAIETPPGSQDRRYCFGDAPHRIFNLGNNTPVALTDFIAIIEKTLGQSAEKIMAPMAPGDVTETWADIDSTTEVLGFKPQTCLEDGIPEFIQWYKDYYA